MILRLIFDQNLLYKSTVVVEASAFNSDAVDDIRLKT